MAYFRCGNGGGSGGGEIGGTATNADISYGKTVTKDGVAVLTGSMPNNGTVTQTLDCGESYTIPAGQHSGSGTVTANSLASQTSIDGDKIPIDASHIPVGYQGWAQGSKITGTGEFPTGTITKTITISGSAGWRDAGNGTRVRLYTQSLTFTLTYNTETDTWGIVRSGGNIRADSQKYDSGDWNGDSYQTLAPSATIT